MGNLVDSPRCEWCLPTVLSVGQSNPQLGRL